MMKGSTFVFTCVAVATGIALFHIKYQVVGLEKEYAQTLQHIYDTNEAMHVLRAEWAHLNDPRRLNDLSSKYLKIGPIQAAQFIPMRRLAQNTKDYDQYALNQLITEVAGIAKNGPKDASSARIKPSLQISHSKVDVSKPHAASSAKMAHSSPHASKPKAALPHDVIGDLIDQNIKMVRCVIAHPYHGKVTCV